MVDFGVKIYSCMLVEASTDQIVGVTNSLGAFFAMGQQEQGGASLVKCCKKF